MARLYTFAEGQTEQTYADTVLRKHLAAFGVYMHGPILVAHARRRGVTHRGGILAYLPIKNDIERFLKQDKAADVYFTTMIDLYALPVDFPGRDDADKIRHVPYDRVSMLEEHFAADIDDPWGRPSRFIPHIQLHEFEAILLCRPAAFSSFFGDCRRQIEDLERTIQGKPPELINDGEHTAPSKRILEQFPDYGGANPWQVRESPTKSESRPRRTCCPHFDAWLKRLESLSNS